MSLTCGQSQIDACLRHQSEVITRIGKLETDVGIIKALLQERNDQAVKERASSATDLEEIKELVLNFGEQLTKTSAMVDKGKLLAKIGSITIFSFGSMLGWGINVWLSLKHV